MKRFHPSLLGSLSRPSVPSCLARAGCLGLVSLHAGPPVLRVVLKLPTFFTVPNHRRISQPHPICRVIFDKMQGGPTDFIAESHCAVRSWKNFSLKQEQGEASGIAGKSGGTAGLQRRPDQGSRDFSPDHNLFARSDGTTESVSAVRKNASINYSVILSYYTTNDCGSGIRGPSRLSRLLPFIANVAAQFSLTILFPSFLWNVIRYMFLCAILAAEPFVAVGEAPGKHAACDPNSADRACVTDRRSASGSSG
jgi:hypothetical protein